MSTNPVGDPPYQFYPWIETIQQPSIQELERQVKSLEEQLQRRHLEDRKRSLENQLRITGPYVNVLPRQSLTSPPDYHTGDFPAYRAQEEARLGSVPNPPILGTLDKWPPNCY